MTRPQTQGMKITMLLSDSVQAVGGKLYILGGGWSLTGPQPGPSALAIKIDVPWDYANRKYKFLLELVTSDGQPVTIPQPGGDAAALQIAGEFEAGRPSGLIAGSYLDVVMGLNFGPLALPPGARYMWRMSVNGETDEDWQVTFSTRPAAPDSRQQ